jgi:integrase
MKAFFRSESSSIGSCRSFPCVVPTTNPLFQQDAHRIIRRRAKAAGIETRIGNHTFRATGITAYLKNSGKLEVAQQIANHESPRTTKLYDRRHDEIHSTR